MDFYAYLLICALIGLIPATIAYRKGGTFLGWWIAGALLFIVALPLAITMKPERKAMERRQRASGMKKCPYCAEMILREAIRCRFCGSDLSDTAPDEELEDSVQVLQWEIGETEIRPAPTKNLDATAVLQLRTWGPTGERVEMVSPSFIAHGAAKPTEEEASALKLLADRIVADGWEARPQQRGDAWHKRKFRRRLATPVLVSDLR